MPFLGTFWKKIAKIAQLFDTYIHTYKIYLPTDLEVFIYYYKSFSIL